MGKSTFSFWVTVLLFVVQCGFAQDVIYKKSGDSTIAKVKEISETEIVYKRYDNQEGPDYVILTRFVRKIVFENGTVDVFKDPVLVSAGSEDSSKVLSGSPVVYGKNIISFIPVHIIQSVPYGFGIQYERFLGKTQFLSIRIPASVSFIKSDQREGYSNKSRRTGQMFWTYPGVKIYLVRNKRKFSLAVGSNLVLGVGSVPVTRYNPNYNYNAGNNTGNSFYEYAWDNKFVVGMMAGGSLNFQPLPKLYIGIDMGLGYSFNDNEGLVRSNSSSSSSYNNSYTYSNNNYENAPLVQFALSMGYRF